MSTAVRRLVTRWRTVYLTSAYHPRLHYHTGLYGRAHSSYNALLPRPHNQNALNPRLYYHTAHSTTYTSSFSDVNFSRDLKIDQLDNLHLQLQQAVANNRLDAPTLLKFTHQLQTHVYNSLSVYKWFQTGNYDVAYIQLLLDFLLEKLHEKCTEHPCYNDLYSRASEMMSTLDAGQAASVMVSFLSLGLPLTDDLTRMAVDRAETCAHHVDIHGLSSMTTFARMLGRNGMRMTSLITSRANDVLDRTSSHGDVLQPLLNIFNTIQLLSSSELSDKFQQKFISILDDHAYLLKNPRTMGGVLRGIRRFPLNKSEEHYQFRNRISDMIVGTLRNDTDFSKLNHSNIGELCNQLQTSRLFYRDLAERFQERALELIASTDRICDISNSLYAFQNKYITRDSRRIIDSQVFQYITDADILLLSNLADTLKNINCRNTDIMNKFHQLILENADSLFVYITRLDKVVKCLSWQNFREREHEERFMNILLSKLSETQLGLATWCLTTVACYLLRNVRYTVESVLYEKLLRIIPQCQVRDLYPILVAMNSVNTIGPSAASQMYHLQTMIYENVADRMDTIDSLDLLSQIISEFLMKSMNPDSNILEKLMSMYPKLTSGGLTKPQYQKVIMTHIHTKYYNPEVCEHLTEFVLNRVSGNEETSDLSTHDLVKLMTLLNVVGYTPVKMGELRHVLLNFYDLKSSEMDVDEVVSYVLLLAGLHILPEDIIADIFTMEFIQRVDKFLEANPEKRQQVEYNMMKLNRIVVIECPELDVPWFHENYCQQNVVKEYDADSQPMSHKVDQSLQQLLGGHLYHKTWSYTPYYYHINIELLLDKYGSVVDMTLPPGKQPKGSQKVAVRCLVESNFCYNEHELNGFEKIKRRHLEMLGYKVIEIPYYEWNSMGLADDPSKQHYLRKKIFS